MNKEDKKNKAEDIPKEADQAAMYKEKWMRALAEYDNLKKRHDKEKAEFTKFANQLLIAELFPIMDSFDSAISSIEKSDDKESFMKGLKMLQREFHKILEMNGLRKTRTVGERFDPYLHQAEEEVCTDAFLPGIIVEEIRGGYTLNDRLLRPALVKVSKGKENKEQKT